MKKVFSCADGCNIKIYYQDTDSTHSNYEHVDKIENGYRDKYGSELVGEDLGNFHTDFSMDNASTEIYAIGISSLVRRLTQLFENQLIKMVRQLIQNILKMKGIPTPCTKYYAEQHNITVLDVYTKLSKNKTITFDFTNDNTKLECRNNENHTISNASDFTRKCQHIRDESDKFFVN